MWPIQPHARFFVSSSTSHGPACLHNSSFQIVWSHQMYRILLRHLLKNTCNFWFSSWVSLQVSAPYKSTIFTFDPKTLNLVLVVSDMDCYVSLTLQTPSLPFQFIAWWPTQFPFLLTILISYLHLNPAPLFFLQSSLHPPVCPLSLCIYLQATLCTLFLTSLCFVLHILYPVWQKGQII